MSISTTRNFIEKSGCGIVFAVVLAVVMGATFFSSCGQQDPAATTTPEGGPAAATIGSTKLTLGQFEQQSEKALNQQQQRIQAMGEAAKDFEGFSSADRATFFVRAVGDLITAAVNVELANQKKIPLTDASIKAEAMKQFQAQIDAQKQSFIQQGTLKADATQADLSAAFKSNFGMTLEELNQQQSNMYDEMLKNPEDRLLLAGGAAQQGWIDAKAKELSVSDEDLNRVFDTVRLKSIVFQEQVKQDRTAEAEKVLAEIKSGAITFEAAMEKYSSAPLQEGKKKKSENEDVLAWQFLLADKNYGPVKNLKPGEISGVIPGVDGPILYKMIKVEGNKPADFDQRKAFYRENHLKFLANNEYFTAFRASRFTIPKFENKGIELVFKYHTLLNDPNEEQDYVGLAAEAAEASAKDPMSRRPAAIARFLSLRRVFLRMTPEQQAPLKSAYIESLQGFLEIGENASLRMELVDLLVGQKSASAGAQLLQVANANGTFGPQGQKINQDIFAKLTELEKLNLVTSEEVGKINERQQL